MDTYEEYQWKYFNFVSQKSPYQYFKGIFQLTVRKIFHLWPKETGLFNVWAFSGEIFNFEEDSDLLPDGDDDDDGGGGGGDGYDSVDLLPEYFLDHVLDVFGIKWNDAFRVWQK